MGADGLTVFLRAQYDKDERVANACTDAFYHGDRIGIERDKLHPSVLMHVYTWTSARVLREVEAKRCRLDRHRRAHDNVADRLSIEDMPDMCNGCGATWPCPDLLADASVYADAPGFRDEWRLT